MEASLSMPITGRWFDTIDGVNRRDLTWEPTGVVEYVIPSGWLGGTDMARKGGNPTVGFFVGAQPTWSNVSGTTYTQ